MNFLGIFQVRPALFYQIYDIVSGIGNQNSDVRDSLCMKYVYLVYLSVLKEKKDRVYKCIFKQIQEEDNSKEL